jgi:hypothetical protein
MNDDEDPVKEINADKEHEDSRYDDCWQISIDLFFKIF